MRAWAALTPPRRAVQEAKAAFARADVLAAGADPTPRPTALCRRVIRHKELMA